MTELNYYTWFADRKLTVCPAHFVVVENAVTQEKLNWIYENLTGRFCLVQSRLNVDSDDFWYSVRTVPAFEDASEATFFQLFWS